MRRIHFLNVKNGDCIIFQRDDIFTVFDICCGNIEPDERAVLAEVEEVISEDELSIRGNYSMRETPTNPIQYLKDIGAKSIFRFILSHPDMDHMDGIKELFSNFRVLNFWDNGIRREKPSFSTDHYLEEDWTFYQSLINGSYSKTTVVTPKSGDKGKYWNDGDDVEKCGHYMDVLSPTPKLVGDANDNGNMNDASYVLSYRSNFGPVLFCGDSEDKTWEHILSSHKKKVENAFLLIAPHHGRDSERNWDFLNVVNPCLTFIGNARSKHLNYTKYRDKSTRIITNNQAGNIVIDFNENADVYVENEAYAANFENYEDHGGIYRILSFSKRNN
jgi:competence protein ComEC